VENRGAWARGGRCLLEMGRLGEGREWVDQGLEVEGENKELLGLRREIEGKSKGKA